MFYPLTSHEEPFLESETPKKKTTTTAPSTLRQLWFFRTSTILLFVAFTVYVVLQYTYLKSDNNNPSSLENEHIFPGRNLYPNDPQYGQLVKADNVRWVGTPAYVALPGSPQQVVSMVQEALDKNLRITIRSGGHCYEDFAVNNPGGVIIVLNSLSDVYRDLNFNNSYVVEAGIRLGDLYSQLYYEYGVTVPGGSCETVGIGGHVLGGGFGLLSRRYGLISDHINAIEIVTVDKNKKASLVFAQENDPDPKKAQLFWAHTGGGGGNFGIVTRFWFRNNLPLYPQIQISKEWDFTNLTKDDFTNLVTNYLNFWMIHHSIEDVYKDMYASLVITEVPRSIAIPISLYINNTNLIDDYYAALTENVSATPILALERVGNFTPLLVEEEGHPLELSPSSSVQRKLLAASYPSMDYNPTRRGEQKSVYMKTPFTPEQMETVWNWSSLERGNFTESPIIAITAWGGQVNTISPSATAVLQRSSIFKIQYQTYWWDPSQDDSRVNFLQSFYSEMYQNYEGNVPLWGDEYEGCYVNYPDILLRNWSYLYYGEHYPILKAVDEEWDPLGVFYHNQSIGRQ